MKFQTSTNEILSPVPSDTPPSSKQLKRKKCHLLRFVRARISCWKMALNVCTAWFCDRWTSRDSEISLSSLLTANSHQPSRTRSTSTVCSNCSQLHRPHSCCTQGHLHRQPSVALCTRKHGDFLSIRILERPSCSGLPDLATRWVSSCVFLWVPRFRNHWPLLRDMR